MTDKFALILTFICALTVPTITRMEVNDRNELVTLATLDISELKQPPQVNEITDGKTEAKVEVRNEVEIKPEVKETSNAASVSEAKETAEVKVNAQDEILSPDQLQKKEFPQVIDVIEQKAEVKPEANAKESVKQDFEDVFLTPDQWPKQECPPLKVAEIQREPTEVLIPSDVVAQLPMKFKNTYKMKDFFVPEYPETIGQSNDEYLSTYTNKNGQYNVAVRKARPGFENLFDHEVQVMKSLEGHKAFPQVIFYNGRNLTTTNFCETWAEYTEIEFYAGGMDLAHGYNLMHQLLDALKAMHTLGFVHRDINIATIAFGCSHKDDIEKWNLPFKMSQTGQLYFTQFETAEYIKESVLNKYFKFAGAYDFVSNATMHDEEPMYVQDVESLGYVLLYGLNGGSLEWISPNGSIDREKNIELKEKLDLDFNLRRMNGDAKTKAKAKADIAKYFELVREHTKNRPKELLDYETLKACFTIDEN